jgi:thiol-disulfide isomerase/thioredoxin
MLQSTKMDNSCIIGLAAASVVALGALVFCNMNERAASVYEGFEGGASYVFTYYYMPQCPYCKQALPEWNKFKQTYKNPNVSLRMVDVTKDHTEANALGIKSFPTWALSNGSKVFVYQGERTASAWSRYLDSQV